jgi:hypothetical protein
MDMKKLLESLDECGMNEMPPMAPPMDQHEGNPVSMNVSLNASGKEHVEDLINMMKNAGMGGAKEVSPDMMPMRRDMERLRDIVDGPKMKLPAPEEMDTEEGYDNEPDEEYGSIDDVIGSGDDLHKSKKGYKAAAGGDNPMTTEDELTLEQEILKALKADYAEKK